MAKKLIQQTVASGSDVLFVGTKRQARHAIEEEVQALRHALRLGALARRNAHQFPHHPRPPQPPRRTGKALGGRPERQSRIDTYSKKMKSTLARERDKIKANLEGIRKMDRMPGVMFIIDTRREHIAVKEARKLGVKTVALIDTDSDPDLIDLPIPGNDDAMRAIEIILKELADAVIEGKTGRGETKGEEPQQPRRRSSRATFRADEARPGEEAPPAETAPTAARRKRPGCSISLRNIATDENQMHTDRMQLHFHLCASDFHLWLK